MSYRATRFPGVTSADSWGDKEEEKELDSPAPVVVVVKNLAADAGYVRGEGLIPGLGRSPEEGMATHSSILA